ncbi:MAG: hypothetical protein ACFB9M_15990 [Myxococcota bacterium]
MLHTWFALGMVSSFGASFEVEALRASGYVAVSEAQEELARAISFASTLEPIVPEYERGRLLLEELHRRSLFKTYDPRATTLLELLRTGRYNCVSSAILFNLAAHRAGLKTRAELQPTHARSQVQVDGRWVLVETTSPIGFDPDSEELARITASVAGQDGALVQRGGEVTEDLGLVAALWANLGTLALQRGDHDRAERFFRESELRAPSPSMRLSLANQRAALLIQIGVDRIRAGNPREGLRAMDLVLGLDGLAPSLESVFIHNYEAATQRWLATRTDEEVETFLGRLNRALPTALESSIRVHAHLRQAQLRVEASDWAGAVSAFQAAHRSLNGAPSAAARQSLAGARKPWSQALTMMGELDRGLSRLGPSKPDRLHLFMLSGSLALEEGRFEEAARIYRRCLTESPDYPPCRHNRVVALQRRARIDLDRGRCDAAAPYLEQLNELAPELAAQAAYLCHSRLASSAFDRKDYFAAMENLVRASETGHEPARTQQNAEAILQTWARDASRSGACAEVKSAARRWVKAHHRNRPPSLGPCDP